MRSARHLVPFATVVAPALRHRAAIVLHLSALALAACSGDDTSIDVDLTGTWRGQIARGFGNIPSDREPYTLTLTQRNRAVTGTLCRDEVKRCSKLRESQILGANYDSNVATEVVLMTEEPLTDASADGPPPSAMKLDLYIRRNTDPVTLLTGDAYVQRGNVTDSLAMSFTR